MTSEKDLVVRFYEEIWNQHNHDAVPEVLDENLRFRGSLGMDRQGHSGFIEYLDLVHQALANYQCIIEDLLSESHKVFAKMKFTGIHQGEFLGFPPTGKRVTWSGAALFTFKANKIIDLWVLGDLTSLEKQLKDT